MTPTDAAARKARPLFSGVLRYFPDALLDVAHCSYIGNQQHNAGEPLHWAKEKSTDEADALVRHLLQAGEVDTDGVRHTAKVAWRALALLQRELEAARASQPAAPTPPGPDAFEQYRADVDGDTLRWDRPAADPGPGDDPAHLIRSAD